MKAVLRGKFRVLSAFIKKLERSHISNHSKALEQKETNSPGGVNERRLKSMRQKQRKQCKEAMKQRVGSSRKSTK